MSLYTIEEPQIADFHPKLDTFRDDFLNGLRRRPRALYPKYFYDAEGSRLFDRICELDEYFPTRTEMRILQDNRLEIRAAIGPRRRIVEFGSGSSRKTLQLLESLAAPSAYLPVEISKDCLREAAAQLSARFPNVEILPICADFTDEFTLPSGENAYAGTTIFFPGSTIGNFEPREATAFLDQARQICGDNCSLLIGVGLQTDPELLQRAYDDSQGVTAAFNRNVLWRAKRELGARVDPEAFSHEAVYNQLDGRIEMRLVSDRAQSVELDGEQFYFHEGDSILTEYSHKFTIESFARLAERAGFVNQRAWTDKRKRFSVQFFESR